MRDVCSTEDLKLLLQCWGCVEGDALVVSMLLSVVPDEELHGSRILLQGLERLQTDIKHHVCYNIQ